MSQPGTRPADVPLTIATERGALAGMLHPVAAEVPAGVVFCHAFAEERKSSALTMARLARAVAEAGLPVLRFDYRGCGDSEGDFVDATVAGRLADIGRAAAELRERTGVERVCLLGLRLGTALAASAATHMPDCAGLVLIEPIADADAYLGGEMRRKLLRQMITHGRSSGSREEMLAEMERDDAVLDMDGFAVRGSTWRELRALGIRAGEVSFAGPVLICQVHFKESLRPDIEAVAAAFEQAGADVTTSAVVLPPFWNRIDVTLAPELESVVTAWLRRHFPA
jgi:exosortase A-associated hydrolase 2